MAPSSGPSTASSRTTASTSSTGSSCAAPIAGSRSRSTPRRPSHCRRTRAAPPSSRPTRAPGGLGGSWAVAGSGARPPGVGRTMHEVELVLVSLLVAVAGLAAAARAVGIPYPIVLVVGGLVLGFVPGLPDVALEPELVLVLF